MSQSRDASIVEVPDSPPRKMDLAECRSPDKATLKDEVTKLREQLVFLSSHSQNVHESQRAGFQRTAREFESYARDVTQAEIAQNTAELEANFHSRMTETEKNIAVEMNVALEVQRTGVTSQAESYIHDQEDRLRQIQIEEISVMRARVLELEQNANIHYHSLHSEATTVVSQKDADISRLVDELQEAKRVIEHHQQASQQGQQGNAHLLKETATLRAQLSEQTKELTAFQRIVQERDATLQTWAAARQKDDEHNQATQQHLQKQMEMMQDTMQQLQIANKHFQDQLQWYEQDAGEYDEADQQEEMDDEDEDDIPTTQEAPDVPPAPAPHAQPRGQPKPETPAAARPQQPEVIQAAARPTQPEVIPAAARPTTPEKVASQPHAQRKEADSISFSNIPKADATGHWKMTVRRKVAAASGCPNRAFAWLSMAEEATCIEDLEDDEEFDTLSVKIAAGLYENLRGDFKRQVETKEEELCKKHKMLNGRQLYYMILKDLERPTTEMELQTWEDLLNAELLNDNLRKFQTDWDRALMRVPEKPTDSFLENLYRRQVDKCSAFAHSMTMYNLEMVQQGKKPSYERLYAMVVAYLNDKRLQRNVGPRDGKAQAAKTTGQDDCQQFYKYGNCSRKECPYKHNITIAKGKGKGKKGDGGDGKGKGKGKGKAKGKWEDRGRSPGRERSPSRDRTPSGQPKRGTSPAGNKERPRCWAYMKGECQNSKCDFWHPPRCKDDKKGTCKLGKDCMFLHQGKAHAAKDDEKKPDKDKKKPKRPKSPARAQIAIASPLNQQGSPQA